MPRAAFTKEERWAVFMSHVDRRPGPMATPCWMWTGPVTGSGYAKCYKNGLTAQAHRYAYEEVHGQLPAGIVLTAACEQKLCVNPDHMETVTKAEVQHRMMRRRGPLQRVTPGPAFRSVDEEAVQAWIHQFVTADPECQAAMRGVA